MKTNVITLLSGASMTGTTTVSSDPILVDQIYGFAIQAVWTGTPNGTLTLQAACTPVDKQLNVSSGGPYTVSTWTDVASYAISGSAGNYMFNVIGGFYNFARITYTNSSSTGTLSANLVVKGV